MMNWNGLGSINLAAIEEDRGGQTLAEGPHVCKITNAELNKTKNGKGHRLAVTLTALDGSGHVTDYMNVHNASSEAQEIGLRRLKTMLVKAGYSGASPDIAKMKGLMVGVHVVRGDDWTDKDGHARRGGGQPRQNNPYFLPSETPAQAPATEAAAANEFDDDIPF